MSIFLLIIIIIFIIIQYLFATVATEEQKRKRFNVADADKDGLLNTDEVTSMFHPEERPHMFEVIIDVRFFFSLQIMLQPLPCKDSACTTVGQKDLRLLSTNGMQIKNSASTTRSLTISRRKSLVDFFCFLLQVLFGWLLVKFPFL